MVTQNVNFLWFSAYLQLNIIWYKIPIHNPFKLCNDFAQMSDIFVDLSRKNPGKFHPLTSIDQKFLILLFYFEMGDVPTGCGLRVKCSLFPVDICGYTKGCNFTFKFQTYSSNLAIHDAIDLIGRSVQIWFVEIPENYCKGIVLWQLLTRISNIDAHAADIQVMNWFYEVKEVFYSLWKYNVNNQTPETKTRWLISDGSLPLNLWRMQDVFSLQSLLPLR